MPAKQGQLGGGVPSSKGQRGRCVPACHKRAARLKPNEPCILGTNEPAKLRKHARRTKVRPALTAAAARRLVCCSDDLSMDEGDPPLVSLPAGHPDQAHPDFLGAMPMDTGPTPPMGHAPAQLAPKLPAYPPPPPMIQSSQPLQPQPPHRLPPQQQQQQQQQGLQGEPPPQMPIAPPPPPTHASKKPSKGGKSAKASHKKRKDR